MTVCTDPLVVDTHAELAAVYFRAVLSKGIPPMYAIQLTQSYQMTMLNIANSNDRPRDPWDDMGPGANPPKSST